MYDESRLKSLEILAGEELTQELQETISATRAIVERFGAVARMRQQTAGEVETTEFDKLDIATGGLRTVDAVRCLADEKRTLEFARAINEQVKAGDIVVEAGAGTGILAVLAAKKGAKRVFAVEINPNTVQLMRNVVAELEQKGIIPKNVIQITEGNAIEWQAPEGEQPNVIISENYYTGLFYERQQQIMNNLLTQTAPNVVAIPLRSRSNLELVAATESNHPNIVRNELEIRGGKVKTVSLTKEYDVVHFNQTQPETFETTIELTATETATVNAINVSGVIELTPTRKIERNQCDFFNNDHILYLREPVNVERGRHYRIIIGYRGGDKPENIRLEIQPI